MLSEKSYLELMVPFYQFVKKNVYKVTDDLWYYGTGEACHWAVQSNFNVAGALAVLATTKEDIPIDKAECMDLALKLFRYNLATHKTGSMNCTCGDQWGGSWITVLGLERMISGQLAMEPFFTAEDKENFRKLRFFEANWLVSDYETVAGMRGDSGKNKPESNYWNGSFIYRCAMDFPDAPEREIWLNKACELLLNAINIPEDAASVKKFRGKELYFWQTTGFNFTPEYSLDHHRYMNIGYSVITLSHAAYLYAYCLDRRVEFPAEAQHHVKDLWEVVKKFIFPDGRLLRIGGDTRARYTYCQAYLLPILQMVQQLFGDQDAAAFEAGMLKTMKHEKSYNTDGSFFGTRLAAMAEQSYYYYTRLESDPFAVLGTGAYWRRNHQLLQPEDDRTAQPDAWHAPFHDSAMVKTEKTVRSVTRRGGGGMVVLNLPLDSSDLAEWGGNGFAKVCGHKVVPIDEETGFLKVFDGGFIDCAKVKWWEIEPWGEGEGQFIFAESRYACAALPDGKTLVVLEKLSALKAHSLFSLRTAVWQIPNDLHNECRRTFKGENFSRELARLENAGVIDTNSKWLNVDDKVSVVLGYGADTLKLHAPAEPLVGIKIYPRIKSLYVDEICADVQFSPRKRFMPGEVMADTGYATVSDVTAAAGMPCTVERVAAPEELRAVHVTGQDGKKWLFAANFGDESVEWEGQTIPAGECILLEK